MTYKEERRRGKEMELKGRNREKEGGGGIKTKQCDHYNKLIQNSINKDELNFPTRLVQEETYKSITIIIMYSCIIDH